MKLVCISDTHGWELKDIPDGDVLIHAGDMTNRGLPHEFMKFFKWTVKLPHKHKICIPGNHDFLFEKNHLYGRELLSNWRVLINESTTIEGVKLYGMPQQPRFYDWAFNVDRNSLRMQTYVDAIPDDTEVLITHGPPAGILDLTCQHNRMGCEQLRDRVKKLSKLKVNVFGHNHSGAGTAFIDNVTFINASIVNESYVPVHSPTIMEI
jgi:Icc-related predicted phosphoesterase